MGLSTRRSSLFRWGSAALLTLLLAVRLVATSGYMPQLEQGRLTLMLCPDGEWTASLTSMPGMAGMAGDHGAKSTHRAQCPYAAAAAIPFAGGHLPTLLLLALLLFPLLFVSLPAALTRCATPFERPFSTGPPLPA